MVLIQGNRAEAKDMKFAAQLLRRFGHQVELKVVNPPKPQPSINYHDLHPLAGKGRVRLLVEGAQADLYIRISYREQGKKMPRVLLRVSGQQVYLVYSGFKEDRYTGALLTRDEFLHVFRSSVYMGETFKFKVDRALQEGTLAAKKLNTWEEVVEFLGGWNGEDPSG